MPNKKTKKISNKKKEREISRGRRNAVENAIELAKKYKTGTWEGIVKRSKQDTAQWEDISRSEFFRGNR